MRYAYGVAMALLLGGTAFSLATGQAGAQIAQNEPGTSSARAAPRRADVASPTWSPSCSRRWSTSRPSSASRCKAQRRSVRGILPPLRPDPAAGRQQWQQRRRRRAAAHPRSRLARLGLHHLARRLCRHQQPL